MAIFIDKPAIAPSAGNKPKLIEEFVGRVNSCESRLSVARMRSPEGWTEPGQQPGFDEYTIVLAGVVRARLKDREFEVKAGQALIVHSGEWVQYSTPYSGGAEYVSICLPAFSPQTVNRDKE